MKLENFYMSKRPTVLRYLCVVTVGVLAFLMIYGVTPLDVTNDNWIAQGYDEIDIYQHYAGWIAFRNDDWRFPLGVTDAMGHGQGTPMTFTDSIPIAAVFFKIFRSVLPETFQYFGIYTLLCYVLQVIAAYKIIFYKTKNFKYSLLGSSIFGCAPILMERAFRHTALGSHWLVLFAIYAYLKHQDHPCKRTYFYLGILEMLAISIHPYFLPMVAIFALLVTIKDICKKQYTGILLFLSGFAATAVWGYVIGALGYITGIDHGSSGYNVFSMNLNAIFNPHSVGGYTWSTLLKTRPQLFGQYDGFNYLGLGILFGATFVAVLLICCQRKKLSCSISHHKWLLAAMIFLTVFAASNIICFDDKQLLHIYLPGFILNLCQIFRASSRMFYPVYYVIFLFFMLKLWSLKPILGEKGCFFILCICIALQFGDIGTCIQEKHIAMSEKGKIEASWDGDPVLNSILAEKDSLLLDQYSISFYPVSVWAQKNHLWTYFTVGNRGDYSQSYNQMAAEVERIRTTNDFGRNLIFTTSEENAKSFLAGGADIAFSQSLGCYVISDQIPDEIS